VPKIPIISRSLLIVAIPICACKQEWITPKSWMSHVTRKVMSHLHRIFTPSARVHRCLYEHICMSHGTHMYESCHAYGYVSFWTRSCFALTLRACVWWYVYTYTYAWVAAHVWMSHITQWISHITHGWVISHIWMSHLTHMNESY